MVSREHLSQEVPEVWSAREKPRQTERKDSSGPGGAQGESAVGARSPSEGTPDDEGSSRSAGPRCSTITEKHTAALGRSPGATTPRDLGRHLGAQPGSLTQKLFPANRSPEARVAGRS